MIIFGTRGLTTTANKGSFHCPNCGPTQDFKHRRVWRVFTLYFIPVLPLGKLGEYVECQHCKGTYKPEVLAFDPAEEGRTIQAQFIVAMREVMLAMVLADGVVADEELHLVQSILSELSGTAWSHNELRKELERVQRSGSNAVAIAREIAPSLNSSGRELALTAAVRIAAADGEVAREEMAQIVAIGEALELSKHHITGIVAGVTAASASPARN